MELYWARAVQAPTNICFSICKISLSRITARKRHRISPIAKGDQGIFEFPASGNEPRHGDCPVRLARPAWRYSRRHALRAIVRSYEDWPRGRIVFGRARDLFIIYADRKLPTPATIARIETHFHLPPERTEIQSDFH